MSHSLKECILGCKLLEFHDLINIDNIGHVVYLEDSNLVHFLSGSVSFRPVFSVRSHLISFRCVFFRSNQFFVSVHLLF